MNRICNIIHKAFYRKAYLRYSISAHCTGNRCIGVDRIGFSPDVRTGILQTPGGQSVRCDRMTMRGISTLIRVRMHILGKKPALLIHTRCKIKFDGMTGSGVAEGFFPADIQFDRSAAHLRGQEGIQRLIENILFVSETASDVWLDHTHTAPRNSQCLADHSTDDMGNLCGGHYHDPAFFHIGIGDRILNMTVLNDRCLISSTDDRFRFFHSLLHIPDHIIGTCQYIVFLIEVDRRITSLHGFSGMDLYRIFLIFYPDQFQCP